ncbi:6-phosphogluconate dehydrogenase C-terminal domain-like protein [Dendrothele bispora CBS 962.96]|uniref:6-phosphogluconate dehydrogenase C-terminal domain-like protein n=1 Tax=Dendrothele bispora (strain CBS 962.96) TaxID=1314807 RepID=A0A4S8MTZ7_DENBC|nr:6-phosphogluconate dehydrogenase C-terminal domain-like protein [Dendrothele bispora CBS 962.96]
MPTIAVVAAGAMGSAVGHRLTQAGCTVLTNLDGRSEATRRRTEDAGMKDASLSQIASEADYLLSILPPSNAVSFAELFLRESAGVQRTSHSGSLPLIFVDCNAVNPVTAKQIAGLFADSAMKVVDAGIIGGPPKGEYNPTFYASAEEEDVLERFGSLAQYGLKISLLKGGVGDASALKMSYAGMTKGTTALFTIMILAAEASSPATAEALRNELAASQPEFLDRIKRAVPGMMPKAYRWVGEMEEIAGFIGGDEGETYNGIAKIYERVEKNNGGEIEILKRFVGN